MHREESEWVPESESDISLVHWSVAPGGWPLVVLLRGRHPEKGQGDDGVMWVFL